VKNLRPGMPYSPQALQPASSKAALNCIDAPDLAHQGQDIDDGLGRQARHGGSSDVMHLDQLRSEQLTPPLRLLFRLPRPFRRIFSKAIAAGHRFKRGTSRIPGPGALPASRQRR
jgi:hypothetical protein